MWAFILDSIDIVHIISSRQRLHHLWLIFLDLVEGGLLGGMVFLLLWMYGNGCGYHYEGIDGQLIPDTPGVVGGGVIEALFWGVVVLL